MPVIDSRKTTLGKPPLQVMRCRIDHNDLGGCAYLHCAVCDDLIDPKVPTASVVYYKYLRFYLLAPPLRSRFGAPGKHPDIMRVHKVCMEDLTPVCDCGDIENCDNCLAQELRLIDLLEGLI